MVFVNLEIHSKYSFEVSCQLCQHPKETVNFRLLDLGQVGEASYGART
jgi:hypothetical protein